MAATDCTDFTDRFCVKTSTHAVILNVLPRGKMVGGTKLKDPVEITGDIRRAFLRISGTSLRALRVLRG
jgi:hypothetical protein